MLTPRPLVGTSVRLAPLTEGDRPEMQALLASDPDNWLLQTVRGVGEDFDDYWRAMVATPGRISFAIRDSASGRLVGTSSFFQIDQHHRSVEIGYTFFRPEDRGTAANPESKLLMLGEAFGAGANRVQFSVSAANERSQAAMLKLGATREGVLRRHRITWTGAHRDTMIFSILADEWPDVRQGLVRRLGH